MIKRYFIAGLLFWLPIIITLLVLKFIVQLVDQSLLLLPAAYQPEKLLGIHIPGFGVVFAVVCIFVTGVFVANIVGRRLVILGEKILHKIPLVRSIYTATKQVVGTIFSNSGESFRKVLLVEYPRAGSWSLAFQTSSGFEKGEKALNKKGLVTVFIPTTPNPTSGFLLVIPREEAIELDVSVDEGLKMVISLGVVVPGTKIKDALSDKKKVNV